MARQHKIPIYNVFVPQGADWEITLIYKDENGIAKNLTGFGVAMQARRSFEHPDKLVDLSVGSGITLDAPNGKITIALTNAQTTALNVFKGVYDIVVTDTVPKKSRLLMGDFEVLPGVTR